VLRTVRARYRYSVARAFNIPKANTNPKTNNFNQLFYRYFVYFLFLPFPPVVHCSWYSTQSITERNVNLSNAHSPKLIWLKFTNLINHATENFTTLHNTF